MNFQDNWERALKKTEIHRPRVQPLLTFDTTQLPYIFLAESKINIGDTVVRKGEVFVERPSLVLPYNFPQFEGFDFSNDNNFNVDNLTNFLLVRGVTFPSLKYNNKTETLDIFEGKLKNAISYYADILQKKEDVYTGLIIGAEDCWQFSLLIFVCTQVTRSAEGDIKRLLEKYRKKRDF
ncbi:MAG: hypothetical protein ABH952_03345 [Candidatus Omnitrophota bacterium]